MSLEELKTFVRAMLNAAFPKVTIQFERISDDPFHIGVGVYGVESNATKWVEDRILDIDEKLCTNTEFALTPLVRDEATTKKHYPELMSPWTVFQAPKGGPMARASTVAVKPVAIMLQEGESHYEYPESVSTSAANEQLALAA